jgi:transcriptional regulator GlxA family with amidase domain
LLARSVGSGLDWTGFGRTGLGRTGLRLSRARELLRAGRSVKEAAWAVGYGSERHFARLYRDRYGVPPGDEKRPKAPLQD